MFTGLLRLCHPWRKRPPALHVYSAPETLVTPGEGKYPFYSQYLIQYFPPSVVTRLQVQFYYFTIKFSTSDIGYND